MTDSPYKPPVAPLEVDASPLRERDLVKAYLSVGIVSVVTGALAGALIGGIIGAVWTARGGVAGPEFSYTVSAFSFVLAFIVNYFVFRFFVNRFIVRKLLPVREPAA